MELIVALLAGAAVAVLASWVVAVRRRRVVLPKGTRPQVRLSVCGVTYDLTDTLIRVNDTDTGLANWVIVGPPHVRMHIDDPPPQVHLFRRFPAQTTVSLHVTGPPDKIRFETLVELVERYPEIIPR